MACPWAKIETPEPVNLMDIMSEEVAKDLQAKEEKKYLQNKFPIDTKILIEEAAAVSEDIPDDVLRALSDKTCDSDAIIALNLQLQFDKEYDQELKRKEQHYNGSSKVSISFDNYRRAPLNADFESDLEEEEVPDIIDRKHWDRFDNVNLMPPKNIRMQDGKMVTKHDTVMNGRKNACKLLLFPPEFQTGDGETFDLKLSNKVFNSLKMYSKQEQVRRYRLYDKKEDQATAEFGLDSPTRLILYKMINNQLLERVNGIVSIGKEAVILHADSDPSFPHQPQEGLPKECAIKVFKTTLSEFKQRDKYIKDDYRFKNRIGNQTTAKIIQIWAEKEMANLMRLHKAGIRCPQVVTLKHHVLVMSFIGEKHHPAPKLKDAHLSDADYIYAYEEIIRTMKKMYEEARLIHADLSEYNILWQNQQCYFIDVSQSVEPNHENAFHFLHRDCVNITRYFKKKDVPEVHTAEELFTYITGWDFNNKMEFAEVRETFKMKPHLMDKPGYESTYNFDAIWEKLEANEEKSIIDVDLNLVEPPIA